MFRPQALVVTFANIGRGTVVRQVPAEDLIPPGQSVLVPSPSRDAQNLLLRDGLATVRAGYQDFADTPDTVAVNGLYHMLFDNDTDEIIRGDENDLYYLNGATWTSISGAYAPSGSETDTWDFDSVRIAGAATPQNELMMCNGVDALVAYQGGGTAVTQIAAATFTGAKSVIGHRGRVLCANVKDSGGDRKFNRVQYSITGDPRDHTGEGSGFVDLDDDAFPIETGAVIAGKISYYKGNEQGGSIVVGTPTGLVNAPYRWDTISKGVGILLPRTMTLIGPGLSFFFGTDGAYIHDGARGLKRIGDEVNDDILNRVNRNSLHGAFSWYNPRHMEVWMGVPTGDATWPTEFWTYNVAENRVSGPMSFRDTVTAAARYTAGGSLTWNTLEAEGWSPREWDTMPWASWDSIGGASGDPRTIYGTELGMTYSSEDADTNDAGTSISGRWRSPAYIPNGQQMARPGGSTRPMRYGDQVTLRSITIRFQDLTPWIPTVRFSTDGSTWVDIADGNSVGTGSGRIVSKTYTWQGTTSDWFQIEVLGGTDMRLHSANMVVTYAGDERHT